MVLTVDPLAFQSTEKQRMEKKLLEEANLDNQQTNEKHKYIIVSH